MQKLSFGTVYLCVFNDVLVQKGLMTHTEKVNKTYIKAQLSVSQESVKERKAKNNANLQIRKKQSTGKFTPCDEETELFIFESR